MIQFLINLDRNTENILFISFRKHCDERKKNIYFDHQNINSLCSRHLLRHRELPVMPMIPRFSRASIPSQTVMPCNQILTILSVGPNHLGSYLISPSVNTSVSPSKNHLYSPPITSTRRLWNLAIQRKTLVCGCQATLPRTSK